jgi:ABC-2 type transport system permease protein
MTSLYQLFLANLKIIYRDKTALFWNIAIPVVIYSALSVIPIKRLTGNIVYKDFVLPGMIAYVIMQGGIYSLAYWMVDLRTRGVIKRFLVTPIKIPFLVLGALGSRMAVMLVQILILSFVGIIIFHTTFAGNYISIVLLSLLGGGIFLSIGLLISNFAGSYQSASPITAAVGLPLTFLGNIFIPTSLFPSSIQTLSKFLPVTYLADGLRQAYLYPFNLQILGKDLIILFLWFIVILVITISVFRLQED